MKRILILVLSFLFLSSFSTYGKCRRVAIVKYATQYGWSKAYKVEVIFISGFELNKVTNSVNYDISASYAVIFWGQNQATVIKLDDILYCGYEITCDCLNLYTYFTLTGYDQDGDKWKICLNEYCL